MTDIYMLASYVCAAIEAGDGHSAGNNTKQLIAALGGNPESSTTITGDALYIAMLYIKHNEATK